MKQLRQKINKKKHSKANLNRKFCVQPKEESNSAGINQIMNQVVFESFPSIF